MLSHTDALTEYPRPTMDTHQALNGRPDRRLEDLTLALTDQVARLSEEVFRLRVERQLYDLSLQRLEEAVAKLTPTTHVPLTDTDTQAKPRRRRRRRRRRMNTTPC